jgi:hypothetical protein
VLDLPDAPFVAESRLGLLVEDRLPGWIEEPDSAAVGVAVALRFQ